MGFFRMPRFLRKFFRRRMTPRTEAEAIAARKIASFAYAFVAWNAAGFVLWQIFGKGNVPWPTSQNITTAAEENIRPAFHYARVLGIQKASVYSMSGLTLGSKVDFEVNQDASGSKYITVLSENEKQLFGEEFLANTVRDTSANNIES